jgi:proline iminopeptidase
MPYLSTTHNHEIYYERHGDESKPTILFLHGGPGGGFSTSDQKFFDFETCNVIFFDQRGSGRSLFGVKNEKKICHSELDSESSISNNLTTKLLKNIHPTHHDLLNGNTTKHLIDDINHLLEHLNVNTKITLFGGSWGSTLALTYAILHPQKIKTMILRGIFLPTDYKAEFLYGNGAEKIFPDAYQRWIGFIRDDYVGHPFDYYWQMANDEDPAIRQKYLCEMLYYEGSMCALNTNAEKIQQYIDNDPKGSARSALIEMFYIKYGCFLDEVFTDIDSNKTNRQKNLLEQPTYLETLTETKTGILKYTHRIKNIPTQIIHGRYDSVCPVSDGWQLQKHLQNSTLNITTAGHRSKDPENLVALQAAVKISLQDKKK